VRNKVVFDQTDLNPKHEIRISKEFQMFKIRNAKTFSFGLFEHLDLGFVSDLDIWISNLLKS